MSIRVHRGDLPDLSHYEVAAVAIDTETMGLVPHRDRLCVVQLSRGDGSADVVRIARGQTRAPRLEARTGRPCRHRLRMQAQRPGGLRDRQSLAVTAVMDFAEGLVIDHRRPRCAWPPAPRMS